MTTVAVRGEAVREVDPELAEFTVTVKARDRDQQTTLAQLRTRAAAMRDLLDGFGELIESRETGGLHVYPETSKRGERVTGYHGSVSTTVVVRDFAALGEMVLTVGGQEQVMVYGLRWRVRLDSPVHRQVRRDAIADAIARAKDYAEALGAQVVQLLELSDPGVGRGPDSAHLFEAVGAGYGEPELQLDPQRQRVTAAVEARFTITAPTVL